MITVIPDLSAAPSFTQSWLPPFCYAPERASIQERERLRLIGGVDVFFDQPHWDVSGFLGDLLLRGGTSLLVALEHRSMIRSQVRSHRGLFDRNSTIKRGEFSEFEVPVAGDYTHLVGMARATQSNARDCAEWLRDGTRAFAFASGAPIQPTIELAKGIINTVNDLPGRAYVNYAQLVSRYCIVGVRIVRMAGYSGSGDANVQVFAVQEDLEAVADEIKSLLNQNAV